MHSNETRTCSKSVLSYFAYVIRILFLRARAHTHTHTHTCRPFAQQLITLQSENAFHFTASVQSTRCCVCVSVRACV